MASAQNQPANVDLFDAYFRRADLDRDGRISGAEAVAFFQGSGLPKQVLAQIWSAANPRQADFLGRAEFYNALKLVTVAQSKRDLTPEMVKAALYGPATAKIPAPQINIAATPQPLPSSSPAAPPGTQSSTVTPTSSQNMGFGGPQVNASRPPLPTSASASPLTQGVATQGLPRGGTVAGPRPPNSSISGDWTGGRNVGGSLGTPSQGSSPSMGLDGFGLATSGLTTSIPTGSQPTSGIQSSGPPAKDTKELNISGNGGNGFASDSFFGGDVFSATPVQPKQDASAQAFSARSLPVTPALAPNSAGSQPSVRPAALDSVQSTVTTQVAGGQYQTTQSLAKPNKGVSAQVTSTPIPGVPHNSASGQSQMPWPKMTQTSVQKYTKVFVEVDTDKDGKVTGEQARNLFLSWRLPREVLKQVWDLSDQDNDSMLSLREFCIALYLMERFREGRPLPATLPSSIISDVSSFAPPTNYGNTSDGVWRPSVFQQHPTKPFQQHQVMPGPGARHMLPPVAPRPPLPAAVPKADKEPQANQPKSRVPELEKHLVDQLSTEEQNSLNSKFKEATEADKKVEELEKEILESREKIEFFRAKMQELVLYKSRCDNRVNEIMERSSADKREVESLAKKYEEKYKQTGDVASKLTIEEATFRDIQEKKMELYQAIVKMEQGGSADGVLQARVDRIQSDLDELVKALNERCKKYGLRGKPITLTELPFGWQPGIQEGTADWDEDWDKFDDEGFTFVKELTLDVQNIIAPPKQKSTTSQNKESSTIESPTANASTGVDVKSDKAESVDERVVENGSAHNKSEDLGKSAPNSPIASSAIGSPTRDFSDSYFGKTIGSDASPRDKETKSDHGGPGSPFSGDKGSDESAWAFDANDDIDSLWGFNANSTLKDTDHDRFGDNYLFDSGFGLNPIKTGSSQAGAFSGSPHAGAFSQSSRTFTFDDSVPSTPLYNIGNSPPSYRDGSETPFNSFSRFDSFNASESGFFAQKDNTFARFDSIRSSTDYDQSHGFSTFDDSDPFGSSGPFRTSLDNQTPRRSSDNWSAF